ncbi:hypothetical protein NUW58_g9231 [Xylaria curta]|uniref:Uncharacterized protein n=1 Tax=Xylaria curta TaxID=42375 RepID=A0ACC1MYZ5_9PEZI|nr:hypothetical protein NUW58_g9231 [Xylaria curta]
MKKILKKLSSSVRSSEGNQRLAQNSHAEAQAAPSISSERDHRERGRHVRGVAVEDRKESRIEDSKSVSHGLFVLYPPPELLGGIQSHTVDIVAVHGLNGKARDTWKDEASGMLWLEDFLPEALPQARIMTFGYDSSLLLSHAKGRIEDFSRDLLNRLWMLRQSPETKHRALVFVAHSLGGIVVKKALILAHEDNRHYGDVLSSTIGVIFMGTPHQGSNIVNWTSFLTNAIQIMSGTNLVRTDLIKELSTHSHTLLEISKSFLPRSADLTIMSFIETQSEPPLMVLVVPTESARLGLPNEMVFPVNAHHRNICRYPSAEDQTYALVATSIKSILSGENDASPVRTAARIVNQVHDESESKELVDTIHSLAVVKRDPSPMPSTPTLVSVVSVAPGPASIVAGPASQVPKPLAVEHLSYEEEEEGEVKVILADAVDEPDMTTLLISGLKSKISATEMGWGESTIELHIPSDTEIRELPTLLKEQAPSKRHHTNATSLSLGPSNFEVALLLLRTYGSTALLCP